jgi:hypothetical protein
VRVFNIQIYCKFKRYSALEVVAESEPEARKLVQEHLRQRKPLGFSERQMLKKNPKRTPWKPGLRIKGAVISWAANEDAVKGVVCD